MPRPKRTFVGIEGEPSTGLAGAEGLRLDLDNTFRMFDPSSTFPDGTFGGISAENIREQTILNKNLKDGEISEAKLATSTRRMYTRNYYPIIDPNDLSVTLTSATQTNGKWYYEPGRWMNIEPKIPVAPLFKKKEVKRWDTAETFDMYEQFSQFVMIDINNFEFSTTSGIKMTYKCRVNISSPIQALGPFTLYETPSFLEKVPFSRQIVFQPSDYFPFDSNLELQVDLMVYLDPEPGQPGTYLHKYQEIAVKGNRTFFISPLSNL